MHSLARLLAMHDVQLNYVTPPQPAMPRELQNSLAGQGARQQATSKLEDVLSDTDGLYVRMALLALVAGRSVL